jgi:hypothetical protein
MNSSAATAIRPFLAVRGRRVPPPGASKSTFRARVIESGPYACAAAWTAVFWLLILGATWQVITLPLPFDWLARTSEYLAGIAGTLPAVTLLLQIQAGVLLFHLARSGSGNWARTVVLGSVAAVLAEGCYHLMWCPASDRGHAAMLAFYFQLWFGIVSCSFLAWRPQIFELCAMANLSVLALWAVAVSLTTDSLYKYESAMRWNGPFGNPNVYGWLCAVTVLAGGFCWRQFRVCTFRRPQDRLGAVAAWFAVAAVAAGVVGLVRSFSRSALVGLAAAGLLAVVRSARDEMVAGALPVGKRGAPWPRRVGRGLRRVVTGQSARFILVAAVILAVATEPQVYSRIASMASLTDLSNRAQAWSGELRMTLAGPVTGWRWDESVYETFSTAFAPADPSHHGAFYTNDFVQAGVVFGLIVGAGVGLSAIAAAVAPRLDAVANRYRLVLVATAICAFFNLVIFRAPLGFIWWLCLLRTVFSNLRHE